MSETAANGEIVDELKALRQDVEYLKVHMADADSIMTEDDYEALQQYRKEKKSGKLVSHAALKKELGF